MISTRLLAVAACVLMWCIPQQAEAQSLADQALSKARSGQVEEALRLYQQALAQTPDNVAILRDYAVVLGSAGKYADALPVVRKTFALEATQPEWALREFAGIYLFGDAVPDALATLDLLIRGGDQSEQTLNRRGLALRWLGRSEDSVEAYRFLLTVHPNSEAGTIGLAFAFADQEKFASALELLKSESPQIKKARIRILNWSGRHFEAQRLLDQLPAELAEDREVLEDRVAASRWGGDPSSAVKYMDRLSVLHPDNDTVKLSHELNVELGHSVATSYRFSRDSFGLTEQIAAADFIVHASAAHAIRFGYQYRTFDQEGDISRTLVRYDLGWSGILNKRFAAYASIATVDYRQPGLSRKLSGDGSISFAANDRLRFNSGGGRIVMDAYPALRDQVTAPFGFGEISYRFFARTDLQIRYSRYSFSDQVNRDRADLQFKTRVLSKRILKLDLGSRLMGLWHDRQTSDFWSPTRFYSTLGVAQAEGRLSSWLDILGEIAAGFQSEHGSQTQHPMQFSGRIAAHPGYHWRGILELGKSTSSVDRALPGQNTYSRWFLGATAEYHFH